MLTRLQVYNDYVFLAMSTGLKRVRKDENFAFLHFCDRAPNTARLYIYVPLVSRNGQYYHPHFGATKAAEMD